MNAEERTCRRTEDAVAFVLHGLEPDEETVLREHLQGCRRCQSAVADAELVAAALADAVEQVDPPERLRESILTEAARTPQAGTSAPDAGAAAADAERGSDLAGVRRRQADLSPARAGAGRDSDGRGGRGPRGMRGVRGPGGDARGTSRPNRRRRLIVAAALALVAVIGVAGVGALAAYTVQLQQQRDAQVAQTRALADVLTQLDRPGTSHATLSTGDGRPVGAVVAGPAARTVVIAGLPANDRATSTYVLWGVSADAVPQPVGTFDVDPGTGVHLLGPAGEGQLFVGYAISLEPGRAAPVVPTTVVASGQVQT